MKIITITISLLLLSSPIYACQKVLNSMFNLSGFKQCQSLVSRCPSQGPLPNKECESKILETRKVCQQGRALVHALMSRTTLLSMTNFDPYYLVAQYYIGDGKTGYSILTPKGCLVSTLVNPKKVSTSLAKQYRNTSFGIMNLGKPSLKHEPNEPLIFSVPLRITDTCLACRVIGDAVLNFEFTEQGKLAKITLASFSRHQDQ